MQGFVLAGGAANRMLGIDKPLAEIGGRSLVERAVTTLVIVAEEGVTIVGNSANLQTLGKKLKVPVITDEAKLAAGRPIIRASTIGLATTFYKAETEWVIVLACDLPFVTAALLQRLSELADSGRYDAVVARQQDGRLQPLCAVYRAATCLTFARETIARGRMSLQEMLKLVIVREMLPKEYADLPRSELFFFNVNTPGDLRRARGFAEV